MQNLKDDNKALEAAVVSSDSTSAEAAATITSLQKRITQTDKLSVERDLLAKQVRCISSIF